MTQLLESHATPERPGTGRDSETARLIRARDPEGLRRLLNDHAGIVRGTLRRDFRTVLDHSEIDDALNQATHRVWQTSQPFDPARGTLRTWFYVIARNCALRLLEGKRGPGALRFVADLDAVANPEARLEFGVSAGRQAFVRDLYRCIDKLSAQQRSVIRADLAAGGLAETAHLVEELRTTPNTIYVARASARKALRIALLALGHPTPATETTQLREVTP